MNGTAKTCRAILPYYLQFHIYTTPFNTLDPVTIA